MENKTNPNLLAKQKACRARQNQKFKEEGRRVVHTHLEPTNYDHLLKFRSNHGFRSHRETINRIIAEHEFYHHLECGFPNNTASIKLLNPNSDNPTYEIHINEANIKYKAKTNQENQNVLILIPECDDYLAGKILEFTKKLIKMKLDLSGFNTKDLTFSLKQLTNKEKNNETI